MIKPKIIDGINYRKLEAVDELVVYRNDEELGVVVCISTPYEELVKEVDDGVYYCDEPQPEPPIPPEPPTPPEPEYVDDSTALAELEEVIDND